MNIKIGVCYHKPYKIHENFLNNDDYLLIRTCVTKEIKPIQEKDNTNIFTNPNLVSSDFFDLNKITEDANIFMNMQRDNTGDNIAKYNGNLNEMTVIYWLYKNIEADYYGLFHYRRYLPFDKNELNENTIIAKKINVIQFSGVNILTNILRSHQNEFIVFEFLHNYINKHPQEKQLFEKYLQEQVCAICNLFIMPRNIFKQYGKFVEQLTKTSIELIHKNNISSDNRIYGWILQRMTGYFIYKMQMQKNINVINKPVLYVV